MSAHREFLRRLVLVGGGARSGKSRFALERARALGRRRLFVATAEAWDDEMRDRIARHRQERDASFETREVPRDLPRALAESGEADVIVVDCLTLYLSNLLVAGLDDAAIDDELARVVRAARATRASVVLVTNEVGLGIVPENPLARRFRDHAGRLHASLAAAADEVYVALLGTVLRLLPGPVEVAALARPEADP